MDPILVDVNVHPTKLEVRLSKEDQLYDLIVTKSERLLRQNPHPTKRFKSRVQKNKVLETFEQQKLISRSNNHKLEKHLHHMYMIKKIRIMM